MYVTDCQLVSPFVMFAAKTRIKHNVVQNQVFAPYLTFVITCNLIKTVRFECLPVVTTYQLVVLLIFLRTVK